jgi:hypothetical protein
MTGATGASSSSVPGYLGPTGTTGPTGTVGSTGSTGATGGQGVTGPSGTVGLFYTVQGSSTTMSYTSPPVIAHAGSTTPVILMNTATVGTAYTVDLDTSIFQFQTGDANYHQAIRIKRTNLTGVIKVLITCTISLTYNLDSGPVNNVNMLLGIGIADVTGLMTNFSPLSQEPIQFATVNPSEFFNSCQTTLTSVAQFAPATPDQYLFPWIASIGSPSGSGSYQVYSYSIEIVRL